MWSLFKYFQGFWLILYQGSQPELWNSPAVWPYVYHDFSAGAHDLMSTTGLGSLHWVTSLIPTHPLDLGSIVTSLRIIRDLCCHGTLILMVESFLWLSTWYLSLILDLERRKDNTESLSWAHTSHTLVNNYLWNGWMDKWIGGARICNSIATLTFASSIVDYHKQSSRLGDRKAFQVAPSVSATSDRGFGKSFIYQGMRSTLEI